MGYARWNWWLSEDKAGIEHVTKTNGKILEFATNKSENIHYSYYVESVYVFDVYFHLNFTSIKKVFLFKEHNTSGAASSSSSSVYAQCFLTSIIIILFSPRRCTLSNEMVPEVHSFEVCIFSSFFHLRMSHSWVSQPPTSFVLIRKCNKGETWVGYVTFGWYLHVPKACAKFFFLYI